MIINDNGVRREATPAEADCHSPQRRLLSARKGALALVRDEAERRLGVLFGEAPGSNRMVSAQIGANAAGRTRMAAIRAAEKALSDAINAASDEDAVMAIQAGVETDTRWP